MSHLVTIQTQLRDPTAITAACRRLGLPAPVQGTARLYSGEAIGLLVQLPGWQYPAVIETTDGSIRFDIFEGAWGNRQELDRFLQTYAIEAVRLAGQKKGYVLSEQQLADGSVKLQLQEGS